MTDPVIPIVNIGPPPRVEGQKSNINLWLYQVWTIIISLIELVDLTLPVSTSQGGTGADLTPSMGGIIYSIADEFAVLAGTAIAQKVLMSGATAPPVWSTTTYPLTSTLGDVVYSSANNVYSNLAKATTPTRYIANTGTSSAPAWDEVNLANGVTGNLGLAHFNSGAGATGSTFWCGNGTWAVPSGTATGTVTSVAMTVPAFLSISGSPITTSGTLAVSYSGTALPVANGGTAATSASITAFNNITGYTASGATGTTSTNLVFSTSPTLVTPLLGTPTSGNLSNCTGYATANLTGLGTGVGTWLATPSSANLAAAITDETGSGALVFATSPTFVTPILGTPQSGVATNLTGLPLTTGVTGVLPIANGGTNVSSVTISPAATAFAGWDTNKNFSGNNFLEGYATTATAAGTTTLTVGSAGQQYFTGSTTQTIILPVVSTLALGLQFRIVNNSSGALTVNSSGGNLVQTMAASTTAIFTVIAITGTDATPWSVQYSFASSGTVTSVAMTVPGLLSISGSPITTSGTLAVSYSGSALPVANGGTAATSASITAFNNITGYTASGATGTTSTNLVFSTSPTLVTPVLGTPTSGDLSNCTGYPAGSITGLGAGVATWLATPSSANLASAMTDETGSGALVFATSPTLVTPILGTPQSGVATNLTGLPLTTGVTGVLPVANGGTNASSASITAFNNITGYTASGATGTTSTALVFSTSPSITTPVLVGGLTASGSGANTFVSSSGTFITSTGANTLSGAVTINDATTPSLTTASGKTNTGFLQVNGKTSGALKILPVDAAAQTVTLSLAAQTVGTATLTIPNMANVNKTIAWLESPSFTTPALGTPSAGVLTSCTGLPLTTGVTGVLPIANGGTANSSLITAATASTIVGQDANKNYSTNNLLASYTTTATAGGTTTLTVGSTYQQFFTGTQVQTVQMPVASTLVLGQTYLIVNQSTLSVTVQSSGSNTIGTVASGAAAIFTCVKVTGTDATSWNVSATGAAGVSSITGTANQVIASSPTGTVTLSLPQSIATSSTVQFTGVGLGTTNTSGQAFTGVAASGNVGGSLSISNATTVATNSDNCLTLINSNNTVNNTESVVFRNSGDGLQAALQCVNTNHDSSSTNTGYLNLITASAGTRVNALTLTNTLATFAGNITIPTSTSSVGNVRINGATYFHNGGISTSIFLGPGTGNYTSSGGSSIGMGNGALPALTTATDSIAMGRVAGKCITTGIENVYIGVGSGQSNATGTRNTGVGSYTLDGPSDNNNNSNNTAIGWASLTNITTGQYNTASGDSSGYGLTTGGRNLFDGYSSGSSVTTGSGNIIIGGHTGSAGQANATIIGSFGTNGYTAQGACYIDGIYGKTVSAASGSLMAQDATGLLGTLISSRKFKDAITDLGDDSSFIYGLRPVSFNYKNSPETRSVGLIAEEVPDCLCIRDGEGAPLSVRYVDLIAYQLNELIKLNARIKELEQKLAED